MSNHVDVGESLSRYADRPDRGALRGVAAVLVAATSWGCIGPAVLTLPSTVSPVAVAAVRAAVAGVAFTGILAGRRPGSGVPLNRSGWIWLILAVAANVGMLVTFLVGVVAAGATITVALQLGLAPMFVGLLIWAGDRSALSRNWFGTTIVVVTGCLMLLFGQGLHSGPQLWFGAGAAAVSGVYDAVFTVAVARLVQVGHRSQYVISAVFAGTALVLAPLLLIDPPVWVLTPSGAAVALFVGLVATTGGYLMLGFGFRYLSAALISTLGLIEPVVAALIGVVLLEERLNPWGWVGLGLTLGALAWLASRPGPGVAVPERPCAAESSDGQG